MSSNPASHGQRQDPGQISSGCGRMEWAVLNWNTPAIEFYRRLGAVPLEEWTTYRLTGEALRRLGQAGDPPPFS